MVRVAVAETMLLGVELEVEEDADPLLTALEPDRDRAKKLATPATVTTATSAITAIGRISKYLVDASYSLLSEWGKRAPRWSVRWIVEGVGIRGA